MVALQFDRFDRARSQNGKVWQDAPDVDVPDWLCWLNSRGKGTTVVHATDCPGVSSKSLSHCRSGGGCAKRYAAASLEKGFVLKLKGAMTPDLGKTRPWGDHEKRVDPADDARVRTYLLCAREEQRPVGVTINQALPTPVPLLTKLIRYMRSTVGLLQTPTERISRRRDIALFVGAFYTAQRGFDLSVP